MIGKAFKSAARDVRNATHQKQDRMQVQKGIPNVAELSEGVPTLRSVPGIGIVQYIRYNSQLYSSAFSLYEPVIRSTIDNISLLNNGAAGDESFNGTVSNSIDANNNGDLVAVSSGVGVAWGFSTEGRADAVHEELTNLVHDVASLAGKINEIIKALRKANLIGKDSKFLDTKGA